MTYDAERRLVAWQNGQIGHPASQWVYDEYDGAGQRVEQYVSGGSGSHTYYLPGNVEEVTPSNTLVKYYAAGGLSIGLNMTTDASGISYLASDGLGSVSEALSRMGTATFHEFSARGPCLHRCLRIVYTGSDNRRTSGHRTRKVRRSPPFREPVAGANRRVGPRKLPREPWP